MGVPGQFRVPPFSLSNTMSTTNIPTQSVQAQNLERGDIILFSGGKRETVRKLIKQRDHKILVKTDTHPDGILANDKQLITVVPR